jgi:hypothetical protein
LIVVDDREVQRVRARFARHELHSQGERCWLLLRRRADGSWTNDFAAEIIASPWCGMVTVVGRSGTVSFGHCFGTGIERGVPALLAWLGDTDDLSYVAQKACIGMGDSAICGVWSWDDCVADIETELARDTEDTDWRRLLSRLRDEYSPSGCDTQHQFIDAVYDVARLVDYDSDYDGIGDFGMRIAPRVLNAHAAIRRLCELLRATAAVVPTLTERETLT